MSLDHVDAAGVGLSQSRSWCFSFLRDQPVLSGSVISLSCLIVVVEEWGLVKEDPISWGYFEFISDIINKVVNMRCF